MRNALVLLAVALLAGAVPAPASSATKYRPCTLLTAADLERALKAKVTRAQQRGVGPSSFVKLAGAECRIFGNIYKQGGPVGNSTNCLTAGKGRALTIEINTAASTPVPPAVPQGLLGKAIGRLL
jgi:hypothetical protein